uniref:F-box domain-containing protein n=1 Tax=Caenorhabditis tropicalis TaxID=1561998 RepID=A0A1I7UTH7_9PELO
MEFRLLSLPFVAIKQVLTLMSLQEQFLFSITSETSKYLVKSANKGTRLSVVLIDGMLHLSNQSDKIYIESQEHGDPFEVSKYGGRDIISWKKPLHSIMEYFVQVFKSDFSIFLPSEFTPQKNLEFLKSLRVPIHSADVTTNRLQETLDALKGASEVKLYIRMDLADSSDLKYPFHFDSIYVCLSMVSPAIRRSLLFSLLDCREVSLLDTKCSTQDLVEFLGKWINGSRIEKLRISFNVKEFNDTVFEQLGQVVNVHKATVEGKQISPPCFFIRQKGTETRAIVYTKNFHVIMTTDFKLII